MRLIKKWLSGALCLVLLLGLLPTAALAEGETADWADPAVTVLKEIYGSDLGVSSSLDPMLKSQAAGVFTKMGNPEVAATLTGEGNLTRGEACTALVTAFAIPTGGKEAINYLFEQNIVNGKSEGDLGAEEPVSFAEFAVLTYRVLNFVGGGKGSSVAELKPGTEAYFAWMYLAARRCVAFKPDHLNDTIDDVTDFTTYDGIDETEYTDGSIVVEVKTAPKSGKAIWEAWVAALSEPKIGGLNGFGDSLTEQYDTSETMKEAATRLMGAFISEYTEQKGSAPTIFTDVTMSDWWYDGVMYSFDAGYINGLGNGTFEPKYRLPLYEFAALLYRINPVDDGELAGIDLPFLDNLGQFSEYEQNVMGNPVVQKAMKAAVKAGYLSWVNGENEDFDPTDTVARGNAIADILKACVDGKNIDLDLSSVNTAILDRFSDTNGLSEIQKQYLAYAVSCGMVNGTSPTTLAPDAPVSRADAGVLLYRTLIGLDYTKMKDYRDSVDYAKTDSPVRTFALFAAPAPAANEAKTLTLREDWRLTDELDLAVPEGTTLTIDGQGKYHIYEMGGTLQNSGPGKVVFAKDAETTKGTILYPQGSSETCTPETSDGLMEQRQPHKVTVAQPTNGTVTVDKLAAKEGETVTLTITADSGYEPADLNVATADGTPITVTNNTFTMPAADVTVSATFRKVDSGSSGGSGPTNYSITPPSAVANGTVQVSPSRASKGSTVTITVTPDQGYELSSLTVEDRQGKALDLTDKGDGMYTFTMPASSVSIQAAFREIVDEVTPPFTDIREEDYYYDAVLWAVENGVTTGTGGDTFAPHAPVSRAQAVTFQWRAAGSPAASGSGFDDVAGDAWYTDAVTWAVSEEITNGTGGNHFSPDAVVSRAQAVTFLYREQA